MADKALKDLDTLKTDALTSNDYFLVEHESKAMKATGDWVEALAANRAATLAQGERGYGITSIEQEDYTATPGRTSTILITYSDGQVCRYSVYNGKDGDGSPSVSTDIPIADGTASVGVLNRYARADHIHPESARTKTYFHRVVLSAEKSYLSSQDTNYIEFYRNGDTVVANVHVILRGAPYKVETDLVDSDIIPDGYTPKIDAYSSGYYMSCIGIQGTTVKGESRWRVYQSDSYCKFAFLLNSTEDQEFFFTITYITRDDIPTDDEVS